MRILGAVNKAFSGVLRQSNVIFDSCVRLLVALANWLGVGYELLNVVLVRRQRTARRA